MNPNDPLYNGPDYTRILFERLSNESVQFTHDHVIGAAGNLIINAIRQSHPNKTKAALALDELAYRMKEALMANYKTINDERAPVFPFPQKIEVPLVVNPNYIYTP